MNRRLAWIAIAVFGLMALSYAWYAYRFPAWTEEVLLPDGRRIAVHQRRDVIEGYGTRRTWLRFSLPAMGGEQVWSEWLYPTMIGAADGKAYVIGLPPAGKEYSMYIYPRYGYVAFQRQKDRFVRIPFMSVPEPLRHRENVRWCLPGGRDSREPASAPAGAWCYWPAPELPHDPYFPRPQQVDLDVRIREAESWARIDGHRPSSE